MDDLCVVPAGPVSICRLGPTPFALLRIRRPSSETFATLEQRLRLELPRQVNHVAGTMPRTWCLAPDTWLIRHPAPLATLREALRGMTGHAADVGAGRFVYRVEGAAAHDLMARGTSVDLHPRRFRHGLSVRTLFADIPVLIDHPGDGDGFEIHADRGAATHMEKWFAAAARSF